MNFLATNIRHLRKQKQLTQKELATRLGLKRAMIGVYEEGRAVPKLATLQGIAHYFQVTLDELVNTDLQKSPPEKPDIEGKALRLLCTVVDSNNNENITLIPAKASAGYLAGYADHEFMASLPQFALPLPELSKNKTYRAFQISGNSMKPIPSGAYIIGEFVQNWQEITNGQAYILVTRTEGITFKRIYKAIDEGVLHLKSDNPEYAPYSVSLNDVLDVWKSVGYISFSIPEETNMSLEKLTSVVMKMQKEITQLKQNQPAK